MFSLTNPIGIVITSATLLLTFSPEARRGTRKLLVKGAGAALALGDSLKGMTGGIRHQLGSFMEEAKAEKSALALPDLSEVMKEGIEKGTDSMKEVVHKAKDTFSGVFSEPEKTNPFYEGNKPINVLNDQVIKSKLNEIEQQLH